MKPTYVKYSIPKDQYRAIKQKLENMAETSTSEGGIERLLMPDGTKINIPEQRKNRGTVLLTISYESQYMPKYLEKVTQKLSKMHAFNM
jgi:hypothetical protein